jgi:hypothetical protein
VSGFIASGFPNALALSLSQEEWAKKGTREINAPRVSNFLIAMIPGMVYLHPAATRAANTNLTETDLEKKLPTDFLAEFVFVHDTFVRLGWRRGG